MNDLNQRIANLSPAKRALLEQRLQQKKVASVASLTIRHREVTSPCPLSFAQQRLWFLDQFEPNSALYNIPKAVRMRGTLDVAALQKALDAIVARHESLRTTFATVDGRPVQVIGDSRPVPLAVLDLRAQSDEARAAEMQRLLSEEAQRPFNLSRDLMLRTTLLRLAEEDQVLLLTMHHIAPDGWSMGVLYRELERDYTAFTTGGEALPAPPIQYADYALWQRQYLQGEREETQLAYWKRQLAGMPSVLDLPTDYPRPAMQTYRGTQQSFAFPQSLSASLKTLSQRQGVTLFMTLLAALQTLLHRYAGQDDIVVGSPIAGRGRSETEELIGLFVNNLVLRTDLSGNPTFEELLQRVREVTLGAYSHSDLPFERLVEVLQPERSLSHAPLFQVMFAFQNVPRSPLRFPGLELSPLDVNSGVSKFDLTLSMWEEAGELQGTLEYSTDLFAAATIRRMLGHFQTLLEGIAAHPTQRLWALPLLTPAERQQLLVEWNATAAAYPREMCLHTLFEEQVERMPHAVAAIYDNENLSYQTLNQRANQLAHYLQGCGVGPGTLVGLLIERSLEMLVGLLGVLKAGGAYVPLDPAYPPERLSFMVRDSQVAVLVTQPHLLSTLPVHQAQVVCLDSDWEALAHERQDNPISGVTAENPAYVIYTSGSTGVPKGVIGLHRGTVNRLHWMWETYPFEAEEMCCQKTSLSFVDAVWEIFGPLLQGVPAVIIPDQVLKDPSRFIHTLAEKHVTRIVLVPSLLHVILDMDIDLQHWLPRLKYWTSSGEALSVELCQRFRERLPQSMLLNLYGSSEVAADATAYDTRQWESLRCVPIGRPIANTQVYLLDPRLQPVPVGVPGELYIGGEGLAQGYLHRPELTTERFIRDPFCDEPGARLFKTGDFARYLPDGNLEFLGRMDNQVKIRGYRIELGEIEVILSQHPAVQEVVVVAREDHPGDKRLVAYLITHKPSTPSSQELRGFVQAALPDYMVPTAFVCLDTLPLTPNGKVDRRALPAPGAGHAEQTGPRVAPSDTLAIQLTAIWEDILGVRPIGMRDDFFELGGHSLLAVRLMAQIEKVFGKELPLPLLFQAPTIEQLANILRQEGWVVPWSALVAIQPDGSRTPFFCAEVYGGNVHFYRDLARHLGSDQPFYVLQFQALEDGQSSDVRAEEMAAHYLKEIRLLQPQGPYFLGGYGSGGQVAFEMAQQLQAQEQEVALLALFDAYATGSPAATPHSEFFRYQVYRFGQRVQNTWGSLSLLQPKAVLPYVLKQAAEAARGLSVGIAMGSKKFAGTSSHGAKASYRAAINDYVPKVYPGRMTLFRSSQQPAGYNYTPQLGWEGLPAEGVEVHEIPGYYGSILMEPRVRILAAQLQACLDKSQTAKRLVADERPLMKGRESDESFVPTSS
jgi:aspartate racemase